MGKQIVLGDYAELDQKLAEGKITRDQHSEIFAKSRVHSLRGDIYPFAVGGSDAAVIMGVSPWRSPLYLYMQKLGRIKEPYDEQKELRFYMGHLFEDPFRELFSKVSGLRATPCTIQMGNTDYPHLVANIDGIVWENGEPGIYEGKTTSFMSSTKAEFCQGKVPIYYLYQVQFYLEIWDLNFAYICCAWGINPKTDMKYIRIERDRKLGKEICQACEKFVLDALAGKRPSNQVCESLDVIARDAELLYGKADSTLPPVTLPPMFKATFERIDKLAEEEKKLDSELEPLESEIKLVKQIMKPIEDKKKELNKERDTLYKLFPDVIQNATRGVFVDGDEKWIVDYNPATGYSLDASVKAYWKENFPESYDKVTKLKPNYHRQITVKKS